MQAQAVRELLALRLSSADVATAKSEWYRIVDVSLALNPLYL